ncbi:MAG: UV DNA damage repair endonuclease UvsE [Desulfobulbaceae bacterium]|nr:UV DNA damage repair endonuclease UvsE [Desulfobulbaceae bacterium]
MLRFGLCCLFSRQPIKFRQTTAKYLSQFSRREQLSMLSAICLANVGTVKKALDFLADNGIGAFRIPTPLFPRYTHPQVGYRLEDLPDAGRIKAVLATIREVRAEKDIRLSFHPDQFNVLSSPHPNVVENTLLELEYQGMLAELIGAEVINIHAGGSYGNKREALMRLKKNFQFLSKAVRSRLTLENDDVSFFPADLLPVCEELGIPFVYDVHHHRCLPDALSEEEATDQCVSLWRKMGREPYFHISSPKNGWQVGSPGPHADYIDPVDFPPFWLRMHATIDIEAKAKELAVLKLMKDLGLLR